MMLAEFADLTLPELTAEIMAMQKTFTPATASPSRDAPDHPLYPAVVGTFSTAARSGQGNHRPADTAVRGTYSEQAA